MVELTSLARRHLPVVRIALLLACLTAFIYGAIPAGGTAGYLKTIVSWNAFPQPSNFTPPETLHQPVIWTGAPGSLDGELIFWGGVVTPGVTFTNQGYRFNFLKETWMPTSTQGAPSVRFGHLAVWTGSQMIVWGGEKTGPGYENPVYYNNGGIYTPATGKWQPISTDGAPDGNGTYHVFWTGTKMLLWGYRSAPDGSQYWNVGTSYNPATNTWQSISQAGAPSVRDGLYIWTGSQLIVWGGALNGNYYTDGAIYTPATDTWKPMSLIGTPLGRVGQCAVWTGSKMVVWGGLTPNGMTLNDGGIYDLATDSWTTIPSSDTAPWRRMLAQCVFAPGGTDGKGYLIVWGGKPDPEITTGMNDGGVYDLAAETWKNMAVAPEGRLYAFTKWIGGDAGATGRMILFGGTNDYFGLSDTWTYSPASNLWTALVTGELTSPQARENHSAVWTDVDGGSMIIFGGKNDTRAIFNDTWSFNPVSGRWKQLSSTGAPSPRYGQSVVWTGTKMIVWGGDISNGIANDGGIFDPAADAWQPVADTGAPAGRYAAAAVWTGSKMIIWGGRDWTNIPPGGGGIYDPDTGLWSAMSSSGAPSPRFGASVVWTGSRMIVWGGSTDLDLLHTLNNGAAYDPASDTWTPLSTVGAPMPRADHSAVWTGSRMLVWGGRQHTFPYEINTGGMYNPSNNTWAKMSMLNAPLPRYLHTAVWTGSQMVIWGGLKGNVALGDGGAFYPELNQWTPIPSNGAPMARIGHTAVWDGQAKLMIVWGGNPWGENATSLDTGGMLSVTEQLLFKEPHYPVYLANIFWNK